MHEELANLYSTAKQDLDELARRLRHEVGVALTGVPHIDRICFRVKDAASFLKKARTVLPNGNLKYVRPFEEIEDVVAGRVITFFRDDIDTVLGKLDAVFNTVEEQIKAPDRDVEFGYESVHRVYHVSQIFRPSKSVDYLPRTFEMQFRTILMHAYAEPQHDFQYKAAGDLPPDIRRELAWIAASTWGADQAFSRVLEWKRRNSNAASRSDGEITNA